MALKLGEMYAEIGANTERLLRAEQQVLRLTRKMESHLGSAAARGQSAGDAIGQGFTGALAKVTAFVGGAYALQRGISSGFSAFVSFEREMSNVASVAGAGAEDMERLETAARSMAKQSVFSATEAAEAQYHLASAGLSVNQIIEAQKGVMDLAAATQSDLGETSRIVASTLSQFSLEAAESGRVGDVFAQAISSSQANMQKLGTSMKYVGPVASAMGLSLERTTAVLMSLYEAGLDGSQAGTVLRAALARLADPTREVQETVGALGVKLEDSQGKMRPFLDIIDDLSKSGADAGQVLKIFGTEAGPGMQQLLTKGTEAILEYEDTLEDSTGKVSVMAREQINNLWGDLKNLGAQFEEASIAIGSKLSPAISVVIKSAAEAVTHVASWVEANEGLINSGVAAFINDWLIPALKTVGHWLSLTAQAVEGARMMWDDLPGPIKTFITTLARISNPIRIANKAIDWIIEQIALCTKAWETISETVRKVSEDIPGFVREMKDKVVGFARQMYEGIKEYLVDKLGDITAKVGEKLDKVTGFFRDAYDKVVGHSYVPDLIDGVEKQFGRLEEAMVAPTRRATEKTLAAFQRQSEAMLEAVEKIEKIEARVEKNSKSFFERIAEYGESMLSSLASSVRSLGESFLAFFTNPITAGLGNAMSTTVENSFEASGLKESMERIMEILKPAVDALVSAVAPVMPALEAFIRAMTPLLQALVPVVEAIASFVERVVKALVDSGVFEAVLMILETVGKVLEALLPPISEVLAALFDIVGEVLGVLLPPILDIIEAVLPVIKVVIELVAKLIEAIKPVLDLILKAIGPFLEIIADAVGLLVDLVEPIADVLTDLVDSINSLIEGIAEALNVDVDSIFDEVGEFFEGVGEFFGLDRGTPSVPRDMVAKVHRGERVLSVMDNKALVMAVQDLADRPLGPTLQIVIRGDVYDEDGFRRVVRDRIEPALRDLARRRHS